MTRHTALFPLSLHENKQTKRELSSSELSPPCSQTRPFFLSLLLHFYLFFFHPKKMLMFGTPPVRREPLRLAHTRFPAPVVGAEPRLRDSMDGDDVHGSQLHEEEQTTNPTWQLLPATFAQYAVDFTVPSEETAGVPLWRFSGAEEPFRPPPRQSRSVDPSLQGGEEEKHDEGDAVQTATGNWTQYSTPWSGSAAVSESKGLNCPSSPNSLEPTTTTRHVHQLPQDPESTFDAANEARIATLIAEGRYQLGQEPLRPSASKDDTRQPIGEALFKTVSLWYPNDNNSNNHQTHSQLLDRQDPRHEDCEGLPCSGQEDKGEQELPLQQGNREWSPAEYVRMVADL